MKKIGLILYLLLFLIFNVNASNTKLRKYEYYSDQLTWKFIDFNLPKGEWIYYSKRSFSLENFHGSCANFLNLKKKYINGHLQVCYISSGGKWRQALGAALKNEWKNNKYDNCSLKQEYFYTNAIFKGASSNCFVSRHIDPNKEIYFPDDPSDTDSSGLKKFIKDQSLVLPKIMLSFDSIYFSNRNDKSIGISVQINPEHYGAKHTLFQNEENSEYHRDKINNYPLKYLFFLSMTKKMSIEHSFLEEQLGANSDFKLDFSDLNVSIQSESSTNFIQDLNKINELYKSGILNAEEFEKAKKKLLN